MATANPQRSSRNGPSVTNRDILFIGDSFPFRGTYNGNTATVWDTSANPVGNRFLCHGELSWARYRSRLAFNYDGTKNNGVFGETNPQISLRFAGALAQGAAMAIRVVSVNASSDANWYSETMAALATDVAAAKAFGTYLVLLLPPATGDSANTGMRMSAAKALTRHQLRVDIMKLYGFSNLPGVDVFDMDAGYADPASTVGDAILGMTSEGLHPATIGARTRMLQYLSLLLKRYQPRRFAIGNNTDLYNVTSSPQGAINANPALDGTGGTFGTGGSGTGIAASWSGGNGGDVGHTRTYSKVTGPNTGRPAQRCALGGTFGASANDISILFQNLTFVVGARYKLQAEFDGWSGVTGLSTILLKAINTSSFIIWAADMDYSGVVGALHPTELDGVMESPEFIADGTGGRIKVDARGIANAAMAGTIDTLGIKGVRLS